MGLKTKTLGIIACCLMGSPFHVPAEELSTMGPHEGWLLLVSPLAGWHENTLTSMVPGPRGMMKVSSTDTAPEYDLFSLFVHPRVVVNNTLFYSSDPNDADITGDFFFVNLYGDPTNDLRWNVGAGYLWHAIDMDALDIDINMPMVKAGVVARTPVAGLQFNPYLGYAWEDVATTYGDTHTESLLYGLTVKYQWRMLHLSLKYYLQDNLDTDKQYNNVKARASFFFNEKFGVVARSEYSEHSQTKDKSFLVGPAIVF